MEMLIIGARGKVLSSCSGTWLEAWAPNILEEAHDFCLNGALMHWLHNGTPWEARMAIRQQSSQEPAFLQVQAGPLPLGKAVSVQSLVSSVLTKLHPEASTSESELNQDVSGLLILDGSGGVRLVSPLPRQRLSLQGLHPHPIVQAKNELLFVQAAMQQLRQLQHHSITVNAQREDGHLVATFPDSEASNWVHVASFDIGDRTICRSASASPATGGVNRFTERLGLQAWPAHLESLGQGVSSLELELPAGCCWPALRAETLLRMLDMAKDYDDTKAMPDVKVGERVEAACREVERLLSTGDILGAYNAWRTRLGMAFPVA
nr:uncharacterized protein LOC119174818 isoform X3 [Rhipicephalus microplus]